MAEHIAVPHAAQASMLGVPLSNEAEIFMCFMTSKMLARSKALRLLVHCH